MEARDGNCSVENFSPLQAPCGAGWKRGALLKFSRAGQLPLYQRDDPRKLGFGADSPCQGEMSRRDRGGRDGEYGREASILSRPRRSFGYFPIVGKVPRPAGRNLFSRATTPFSIIDCFIAPSSTSHALGTFPQGGRLAGGPGVPPLRRHSGKARRRVRAAAPYGNGETMSGGAVRAPPPRWKRK